MQEKVKELVSAGKSMDDAKLAFDENQGRLVESIYNEIKGM